MYAIILSKEYGNVMGEKKPKLTGTLKAIEEDTDPLVTLWKEEILPIAEAFFDAPGRFIAS